MTDQQYALLVLQLAAVGPLATAFDGLDLAQFENLSYLLQEAQRATDAAWQARRRAVHEATIRDANEDRR